MPDSQPRGHRMVDGLQRAMASIRYIWALAAFSVLVGAFILLLSAVIDIGDSIIKSILGQPLAHGPLRLIMIESVDTILVSTVMYVIGMGLFQLFVDEELRHKLPSWMRVRGVGDLESRLSGMVVTVASVIFVSRALEWHSGIDILYFGVAIAVVIAAISLFIMQEQRHEDEHTDESSTHPLDEHRSGTTESS